jgi:excisionase family DNA binding protein
MQRNNESARFIRASEIARQLGIRRETVRDYIRSGELKAVRLSERLFVVSVEAFDAFLAERTVGSKEAV